MEKQKSKELDRIIRRIETLKEKRPGYEEVLEFFKEIVAEQYKVKPLIKAEPIDITEDMVKLKVKEGFPLLDKKQLKLDMKSVTALFENLCTVVRKRNDTLARDITKIQEELEAGNFDLETLFKWVVAEEETHLDTISGKLTLNREILLFLVKNSVKPVLEAYADLLKDHVDQKNWWRGYCPVCGSKPLIGELRRTKGERFLLCSSCGFEWRFKKMECPFCGNEENKKHRYFYVENESREYRVDVCEECRKYIKTIDGRELSEDVVLSVEDLGTLHLDLLAQKEGYERGVANILNV